MYQMIIVQQLERIIMASGIGSIMARHLLFMVVVFTPLFQDGLVQPLHPGLSVPCRMMVIITLILDLTVNILVLD